MYAGINSVYCLDKLLFKMYHVTPSYKCIIKNELLIVKSIILL
jgi:uncharacterized BrkB/YihY/UPF0761 family membrane protein